jgi:tetratricopeptide (TPR) repeat protein
MRKVFLIAALLGAISLNAQTLQDAQHEIDNENYFKAKHILFKLLKDGSALKNDVCYYLGNAYLKSDDADSAALFYKQVFNADSRTALGYVANGRLALLAKNTADAKVNFDRALQMTKFKNSNIFYETGDAYFRPNVIDLQAALKNFGAAYDIDNKNVTNMLAYGDAYLENSTTDNTAGGKAMNKYEAAADLAKTNPLAWIKIGRLAVRGRMYDQAIDAFNKALAIDQSYPVVYKELAEAYYFTKQYDKFKTNLEKYIQLSPGDNQAKASIINIYFSGKEYDKAIEEANKALVNERNNSSFQRVLYISNYELKRYKEAADANAKFWANPTKKIKDADYIYSARIASQVGDTAKAFNYFAIALANDSLNCDLLADYGKALFVAQHSADAVKVLSTKKANCTRFTNADYSYLGRAYKALGDSLNADTIFAEFTAKYPALASGYLYRAELQTKFRMSSDEYGALPHWQKYIEVAEKNAAANKSGLIEGYDYLGFYYFEKAKDKAQAKIYFSKAQELDPGDTFAAEYLGKLN